MENSWSEHQRPNHLAWHETLEIHELVAFQSIGLMKLKKAYSEIQDTNVKNLYQKGIEGLSTNIRDLMKFYNQMPMMERDDEYREISKALGAGDLLALSKTGVRNYAIAITETATPALRHVLQQHLNRMTQLH